MLNDKLWRWCWMWHKKSNKGKKWKRERERERERRGGERTKNRIMSARSSSMLLLLETLKNCSSVVNFVFHFHFTLFFFSIFSSSYFSSSSSSSFISSFLVSLLTFFLSFNCFLFFCFGVVLWGSHFIAGFCLLPRSPILLLLLCFASDWSVSTPLELLNFTPDWRNVKNWMNLMQFACSIPFPSNIWKMNAVKIYQHHQNVKRKKEREKEREKSSVILKILR